MLKDMSQSIFTHATACVLDGYLNIVVADSGRNVDTTTTFCKLTGIVGQRVNHKECQHAVGFHGSINRFYLQINTLHLKTCLATGNDVKQFLQAETFYMQIQLSLPQLNPARQQIVLLIDVVGEFTDIVQLTVVVRVMVNGIKDAVYQRRDTHDERHLGTLL